jgi:hypothetical protein
MGAVLLRQDGSPVCERCLLARVGVSADDKLTLV